jgi:23S rRNA (adenine2503-C2)-methyltransferase
MPNPTTDAPVALTELAFPDLQALLTSWGEPAYRARQIRQWLYQALVEQPAQMSDLPEKLRQRLAESAALTTLRLLARQESPDGETEKALLELRDGQSIESVLMRYEARQTVCVSTQAGCPIGCPFCATGLSGYVRNLTSGEIVDQVLHFARVLKPQDLRVSNVVFMGMGEPFLNYEAVWKAILILNDADGFGLGARHFTISTAGIVPCIRRLADEELQVGLAVSLHAADNELRDELVPLNRKYPLEALIPACRDYAARTHRRVSFEYALIDRVNDDPAQARQLASLLKGMLCHVNLIPLNPGGGSAYAPSPRARTVAFQKELKHRGTPNTLRLGRGLEIKAGCGELRSRQAQEYGR